MGEHRVKEVRQMIAILEEQIVILKLENQQLQATNEELTLQLNEMVATELTRRAHSEDADYILLPDNLAEQPTHNYRRH